MVVGFEGLAQSTGGICVLVHHQGCKDDKQNLSSVLSRLEECLLGLKQMRTLWLVGWFLLEATVGD